MEVLAVSSVKRSHIILKYDIENNMLKLLKSKVSNGILSGIKLKL
jgi:hypothetical protein